MIKFFKGDFADVSNQFGPNNIVFVTDRNTINLDGVEYGKDQFKSVATSAEILEDVAAAGTIYYVEGEQALYEKTATSAEVILSSVSGQVDELKNAISATISGAFGAGNFVVVSKAGAIEKTAYVIDTTSGNLALTGDTLSTTLVNAETLKTQIAAVNQAAATLSGGDGITATKGASTVDGTLWTIDVDLATDDSNTLSITDGKLTDNITLSAISTTAGYAASFALFNTKGETPVQLGSTINIAKNQILSGAEYVAGTVVTDPDTGAQTFTPGSGPNVNRYLHLAFFADANGNGTVDSGEDVSHVYIDVNELFDSYTDGNGITVDPATNTIAINIDSATENFLSVTSSGLKVTGVADAINDAIDGLSSTTASAGQYVTAIGVDASTNTLTASVGTVAASEVTFDSSAIDSLTATTVQGAIAELAADLGDGIDALDAGPFGGSSKYITTISETDGIISATAEDLTADKVAFGTGSNVSAALTGLNADITAVSTYIDETLNLATTTAGSAPTAGNETAYKFINTVSQTDGLVSATPLDLTAANTYQAGDTQVLTGASADVSVGVTKGSVQAAIEELANKIADFGSFHDSTGAVINN